MKKGWFFIATSFGLFLLSGFIMFSCSKDDKDTDAYIESAKDETIADYLFSDVLNQVDLATRQLENDLFGREIQNRLLMEDAPRSISPHLIPLPGLKQLL